MSQEALWCEGVHRKGQEYRHGKEVLPPPTGPGCKSNLSIRGAGGPQTGRTLCGRCNPSLEVRERISGKKGPSIGLTKSKTNVCSLVWEDRKVFENSKLREITYLRGSMRLGGPRGSGGEAVLSRERRNSVLPIQSVMGILTLDKSSSNGH